jgi:acid phosphatase family membrane protein YuiD
MGGFWKSLFESTIFLSAVSSWFLAQLIKVGIAAVTRKRANKAKDLAAIFFWRTGGMPSSHSALVCSIAAAQVFKSGFSDLSVVALFFAGITMRDAVGVRRSSGLQAQSLNLLGKAAHEKMGIEFRPVKEVQGHSPLQVAVGALLGSFMAAAYSYL